MRGPAHVGQCCRGPCVGCVGTAAAGLRSREKRQGGDRRTFCCPDGTSPAASGGEGEREGDSPVKPANDGWGLGMTDGTVGDDDYPTYSDGGTPNCFLKEVEKWERVLKPVIHAISDMLYLPSLSRSAARLSL